MAQRNGAAVRRALQPHAEPVQVLWGGLGAAVEPFSQWLEGGWLLGKYSLTYLEDIPPS